MTRNDAIRKLREEGYDDTEAETFVDSIIHQYKLDSVYWQETSEMWFQRYYKLQVSFNLLQEQLNTVNKMLLEESKK